MTTDVKQGAVADNFREQDILILSGVEEVVGAVRADVVSSGAKWLVVSDSGVGRADSLENMYMNCVMLCFCLTCVRC